MANDQKLASGVKPLILSKTAISGPINANKTAITTLIMAVFVMNINHEMPMSLVTGNNMKAIKNGPRAAPIAKTTTE